MYAKIILVGEIVDIPDVSFTDNGTLVANFILSCEKKWDTGKRIDIFPMCAYGKLAETIENFCPKGSLLFVEGSPKTSTRGLSVDIDVLKVLNNGRKKKD